MKNVMIDLETLGTGSDAMILTIAAVEFNPETGGTKNTFYKKVDIDSYKPYTGCFTMNGSTLTWWMTTAPTEARNEAFLGQRFSLKTVLEEFSTWVKSLSGEIRPWSHGASFDIAILSHSFTILGLEIPWKYWNIRDTRTLYDIGNVDLKTIPPTADSKPYPEHHALGDCFRQIEGVRKSMEVLSKSEDNARHVSKSYKKQKQ